MTTRTASGLLSRYGREREHEADLMPRWLAPLVILALAALAQIGVRRLFGDYVELIYLDCGIAVVLAVSLNIVNGYTGQFSIGHAAFFAIGAYAAAAVTYYASIAIWDSPVAGSLAAGSFALQSAIFVVATLFGGLVAAAAGWLVGLPSLRLRGDYLAIVTLGFGEILRVLLQQTNGQLFSRAEIKAASFTRLVPPPVGGALGFINVPKLTGPFWVTLACGLTLLVAWRLKKSTFGRSMIAIRENEIAAESMGVNVTRLKVWAFVIAAFFAGVAGSLYAHRTGIQITPIDAGFDRSFNVVIIVVLGGLGSISGVALAAVLLTVAAEWLRDPTQAIPLPGFALQVWALALVLMVVRLLVWPDKRLKAAVFWLGLAALLYVAQVLSVKYGVNLGDYRMIVFALVLILTMILRPGGLFGTSELPDLLRARRRLKAAVPA